MTENLYTFQVRDSILEVPI